MKSGPSPQPSPQPGVSRDMEAVAALPRYPTEGAAQLLVRVRDGDETSFALLLERHRGPVVHFVYRMIQNQPVAEELAQEVFLRVYRSRATYEPTAKFTTWLFRIATHVTLNWIRDVKKERGHESLDQEVMEGVERQVAAPQPTVEQEMLEEARLAEVRKAIESLPEKQRAAVLMHKYEGMEYTQIAKILS